MLSGRNRIDYREGKCLHNLFFDGICDFIQHDVPEGQYSVTCFLN